MSSSICIIFKATHEMKNTCRGESPGHPEDSSLAQGQCFSALFMGGHCGFIGAEKTQASIF